jgi:hypothetical protein
MVIQIVRWIICVLLVSFSLYIGIAQWIAMYVVPQQVNDDGSRRGYSMVPLLGGLLGTIGCLIAPMTFVQQFWWLPLIIDPGCALLFGMLVVFGCIAGFKRLFGMRGE